MHAASYGEMVVMQTLGYILIIYKKSWKWFNQTINQYLSHTHRKSSDARGNRAIVRSGPRGNSQSHSKAGQG